MNEKLEHEWINDDWEDEYGNVSWDTYCCICFLDRDYRINEDEEEPCPGHHES